jgi:predicted nucleic acid-binding protein
MNVLVDTSVWVGHFKQRNHTLVDLLNTGRVVCHPHVVLEVACGSPPQRRLVIDLLRQLAPTPVATADELLTLLDTHALHGRGCGLVDISLLASTLLAPRTTLWTLDKRLDTLASELNVAYRPAPH